MQCDDCGCVHDEEYDETGEFVDVSNYGDDFYDLFLCKYCAKARADERDDLETKRSMGGW